MSDISDSLPIVSLPLLFLGPEGIAAYFAINLTSCATAEESSVQTDQYESDAFIVGDIDADDIDMEVADADRADIPEDFSRESADSGQCNPAAAQDCYSGPVETAGVGECRNGSRLCLYNSEMNEWRWGACSGEVTPHDEICDGRDNDCDSMTDEGPLNEIIWIEEFYTGPAWTDGSGSCRAGTLVCIGGSWSVTQEEVIPEMESCDGLDNDCDGIIDENTEEECGGCVCVDGHCDEPECEVESSCGETDGCGGICQDCPPGEICHDDDYCIPTPLDCVVTDNFHFGSDFCSHEYISSPGVHEGISPADSCGASLGVYFDNVGDWVQISLAVEPSADVVRLSSFASTGGVTVQADGFECHELSCWVGHMCSRESLSWHMHELTHNIASDGVVEFVFRAGTVAAGRTDIATVEVESCNFVYP